MTICIIVHCEARQGDVCLEHVQLGEQAAGGDVSLDPQRAGTVQYSTVHTVTKTIFQQIEKRRQFDSMHVCMYVLHHCLACSWWA